MRLAFAGTPEIASTIFADLLQHREHEVVVVLTQPDRPSGRGQKLENSPVKTLALAENIPVYQPLTLKGEEAQSILKSYDFDLMIVVAYGLMIPQTVLEIPQFGCWNIHVSKLPRWRGAAPIQRCIEAGDSDTGVTLMQMDKGLDTGPILLQETCSISKTVTAGELHDGLALMGADLLQRGLALKQSGALMLHPQNEADASYAKKLSKEEARLDWSLSAQVLERKIRAFHPWPICHTTYNDTVIRIWQARCPEVQCESISKHIGQIVYIKNEAIGIQTRQGILEILSLQIPGGKVLPVALFLQGHRHFFVEEGLLV